MSVMPKSIYNKLIHKPLTPTPMMLQLVDSSLRHPTGITEDIPVKIRDCYVPVDFVVLDMEVAKKSTLILGRPLLSTAKAQIDVGSGEISFNIHGKEEKFSFKPRKEQCSMIHIKYGPNPQGLKEVHIEPHLVSNLVKKAEETRSKKKPEQKQKAAPKKFEAAPIPPRMNKKAWQPRENAPKPTPTLPKKTKMVWRMKVPASVSVSPEIEASSSRTK